MSAWVSSDAVGATTLNFIKGQRLYAHGRPSGVITGDFNGDLKQDFAVCYSAQNVITILSGTGTGGYTALTREFNVGSGAVFITAGDLNGDGRLDLVTANAGSQDVSVLLSSGTSTINAAVSYSVGAAPSSIAISDFDGDGKLDLAVACNAANSIVLLLNNGTGGLNTGVTLATANYPVSIAAADFNSDGKKDIVVALRNSNGIQIFQGNGNGTFGQSKYILAGTQPNAIVAADFSGDGKADIAVANNGTSDVTLYTNDGSGGFGPGAAFAIANGAYILTTVDVNLDSKLDLVVSSNTTGSSMLLTNNGAGGFTAATNIFGTGASVSGVASADMNGDSKPDLISADPESGFILIGNGNGTNFPGGGSLIPPQGFLNYFTFGDLNDDGKADVVTANNTYVPAIAKNVRLFSGDGAGNFSSLNALSASSNVRHPVVRDLTKDGTADLSYSDANTPAIVVVLPGTGLGNFGTALSTNTNLNSNAPSYADFNGDGNLDMAVGASNSPVAIQLGSGNGQFGAPISVTGASGTQIATTGDFNGDGKADIIVSNSTAATISLYPGNGNATFQAPVSYSTVASPNGLAVGDLNADGRMDLVVGSSIISSSGLNVFLGQTNGTLVLSATLSAAGAPDSLAIADMDGDGKLDIVASGNNSNITIHMGNGAGQFSLATVRPTISNYRLAVADVNNDGRMDILVRTNSSHYADVWLASPTPTTTLTVTTPTAITYGTSSVNIVAAVASISPVNSGNVTFQLTIGGIPVGTPVTSPTVVNGTTNVTYSIPASTPAGKYTIAATFSAPGVFAGSTDTSKRLTIDRATLTVTVSPPSRVYGAVNPNFSGNYTGIQYGETIAFTYTTTANPSSPVGVYPTVPVANDPTLGNYSTTSNGTFSVTRAPLTISAVNKTKAYGAALPTLTLSYSGFVNGDTAASLTTVATLSTTATAASHVAGNPFSISVSGAVNSNYTISYVPGTLTLTPASLQITAISNLKVYGAALPTLDASFAGFVNGDSPASLTTPPTLSTNATAGSHVSGNPYSITASGAVVNSDYAITYIAGTLTVTPAILSISANNQTKVYGAALPGLTASYAGFVNGDTSANLTTQPTLSTTATAASNSGSYPITASGAVNTDYSISYVSGTLAVGQAALTITAANASRAYGSANPAFTGTIAGILNGDAISATFSTSALPGSAIGMYAIVPTLVDPGSSLGNYAFTTNDGILTIFPAVLTVKAADASRVYHAPDPAFTGVITGILNSDPITATYATSASTFSPVGAYPLAPTLVDPGGVLGNYAVTSFNGILTISKATPLISWTPPARIFAGVPLSAVQLNAAAKDANSDEAVIGAFAYTPGGGAVPAPGLGQNLFTIFTPDDGANYTTAVGKTTLDVDPAVPVAITSPATAQGTQDTPFNYTITASGSGPMVFKAGGLPAGLSLNGNLISGTTSATGAFDLLLTVTNYSGSASQPLRLVVLLAAGMNRAPVFASSPKSSVNPAKAVESISLSASAMDPDDDALIYTWDFGDGTTGLGATQTKIFVSAGVYVVRVTVWDGQASDAQSIVIVVNDSPQAGKFTVEKVAVTFNFAKDGNDSLTISGSIPLPAAFQPAGKSVRILIGDLDKTYALNSKGVSPDKAFSLSGKLAGPSATFKFALKKQQLFAALENLGFSKTSGNPTLDFPVAIMLDSKACFDHPLINYSVKGNKEGPSSGKGSNQKPRVPNPVFGF